MAFERKYTPEEFNQKIDEYFEQEMEFHSYPGLLLYLGITADTEIRYRLNPKPGEEAYSNALKKAADRRQLELSEIGLSDRNKSVFAMFLLKQPNNGGLRDRPKDDNDGPKEINITINGIKAGDAFK